MVAWALEDADKVHKISIVARGHSGGATTILPEEESSFLTAKQARAKLAVFYGGRVAEELIFKEITTDCICDPSFPVCKCEIKQQFIQPKKKKYTPSDNEKNSNSRSKSAIMRYVIKL